MKLRTKQSLVTLLVTTLIQSGFAATTTSTLKDKAANLKEKGTELINTISSDASKLKAKSMDTANNIAKDASKLKNQASQKLNNAVDDIDNWVDDAAITTDITTAYANHPALSAWNLQVHTTDGVVQLKGHANSYTQLNAALKTAYHTHGVKDVDTSKVTVDKSDNFVKDATTSAKIKAKILADKINPRKVGVETVNGNVYLSGKVNSTEDEQSVIATAQDTKNVKSVTSYLRVKHIK